MSWSHSPWVASARLGFDVINVKIDAILSLVQILPLSEERCETLWKLKVNIKKTNRK